MAGWSAEIEAKGRSALPLQMDVLDLKQSYAAIDAAIAAFGKLDILVNNAGGGVDERPVEDYAEADYDFVLDLNVKSTFFLTQYAGKHMLARGSGAIVNMGSQAGAIALPGEAVYCLSKAAVAHMTKCFAVEWGKNNVRVNCVAPTFIETDGTADMLARPAFKADVHRAHRRAASHRPAARGGRRRGVPRLRRRVADHRPDAADRWRLDVALIACRRRPLSTSWRR